MSEEAKNVKKKSNFSKLVTVIMVFFILFVGAIAAIKNSFVDMGSYVSFLEAFVYFFGTYTLVVGAGRATKNVATLKYDKESAEIQKYPDIGTTNK